MKNKKLILIILSFLVVVTATGILGKYLTNFLNEMAADQNPNPQFGSNFRVESYRRVYVQGFFILFGTVCLPFIFSVFSTKINKQNWWKQILVLEVAGLLLVLITFPPDMISRMIGFIIWQLPVLVNFAALRWIIRNKKVQLSKNNVSNF